MDNTTGGTRVQERILDAHCCLTLRFLSTNYYDLNIVHTVSWRQPNRTGVSRRCHLGVREHTYESLPGGVVVSLYKGYTGPSLLLCGFINELTLQNTVIAGDERYYKSANNYCLCNVDSLCHGE